MHFYTQFFFVENIHFHFCFQNLLDLRNIISKNGISSYTKMYKNNSISQIIKYS